ncbi:DUF2911 domain-containing protein [Ekhidna sp.]|uniref:DUF2911 domain-containing protein n=1 Tax=Ekhidna sp. TaxID=2608089 RepID=UPI0032EC322E
MKKILLIIAVVSLIGCTTSEKKEEKTEDHSEHQHEAKKEDTKKKPLSPRTASMSNFGNNHVHIDYGSPSKRGRMIFGGLVGYGTVWATGAHKATTISFDKDVIINSTEIPAGKYGLFTIPGEEEWTVIISKDWDMHLADEYDETNDVVRVNASVQKLEEVVESLTFEVSEISDKNGQITIKWDQTGVSFDIKNQ